MWPHPQHSYPQVSSYERNNVSCLNWGRGCYAIYITEQCSHEVYKLVVAYTMSIPYNCILVIVCNSSLFAEAITVEGIWSDNVSLGLGSTVAFLKINSEAMPYKLLFGHAFCEEVWFSNKNIFQWKLIKR